MRFAMDKVLTLQNISKNFDELKILTDVSMEISRGQKIAILGPSGAGKSTLLHISGLMERPSSGTIYLEGKDSTKLSETELAQTRLNTIGFLFQFHYLLPEFDVLENTMIPIRLAKGNLVEGEKEAQNILDRLGLTPRLHHRPSRLSGGEQQRAALARAMIQHPRLLLCDEPTGNLDSHTAHDMMNLIWEEVKLQNLATVIVTHNEDLASHVDISYHLSDGKLKQI